MSLEATRSRTRIATQRFASGWLCHQTTRPPPCHGKIRLERPQREHLVLEILEEGAVHPKRAGT